MKQVSVLTLSILTLMWIFIPASGAATLQDTTPLAKGHKALSRIYEAHEKGELTQVEFLTQLGYFIYKRDLLDAKFKPEPGSALKCGTLIVKEIQDNFDKLPPETQAMFRTFLARPTNQHYYDTPEGNFRIHYDTTGPHAIFEPTVDVDPADTIPDSINRAAEVAEYTYIMETTAAYYNYFPAPADQGAGGNDRYDIYFQNLGTGLYGQCVSEGYENYTYPTHPYSRKTYVQMHSTFDFHAPGYLQGLMATTPHEYGHAVQGAYNWVGSAIMENHAMLFEEMVYDDVNEYYDWIEPRFTRPDKSLRGFNGTIEYATIIWPLFWHDEWGADYVRGLWDYTINRNSLATVYEDYFGDTLGTDLVGMYQIFLEWFYISAEYDDGQHYEEGAAWTDHIDIFGQHHVRIEGDYTTYPASGTTPGGRPPEKMGCNYHHFHLTGTGAYGLHFSLNVDNQNSADWAVAVIAYNQDYDLFESSHYLCDANGDIELDIYDDFQQYSRIAIAVVNVSQLGPPDWDPYSYTATLITQPPVPTVSWIGIVVLLIIMGTVLVGLKLRPQKQQT